MKTTKFQYSEDACEKCMDKMEINVAIAQKVLKTTRHSVTYQFRCDKCGHVWPCTFGIMKSEEDE